MRKDEMKMSIAENRPKDFTWHHSDRLMDLADAKQMDYGIVSLDPDKFSYPYHFHHNIEELFVILSGSALLRTPEGIREVTQGDAIFFELGEKGAHQMYNDTDKPCQYLDLSIDRDIDVCEYPDTGKINVYGRGMRQIHYKKQTVGYFDGEENVRSKWDGKLKEK
jgi:uncharacterized cupin superfamily protein